MTIWCSDYVWILFRILLLLKLLLIKLLSVEIRCLPSICDWSTFFGLKVLLDIKLIGLPSYFAWWQKLIVRKSIFLIIFLNRLTFESYYICSLWQIFLPNSISKFTRFLYAMEFRSLFCTYSFWQIGGKILFCWLSQ